jgi:ankyrin repeat protein
MSGFYWLVAIVLLAGCGKKPRPNAADELHRAAQNGDLGQVQALIARGVPVDARGLSDTTALHDAAWSGNVEVAEILVRCGARVDSVDSQGRTPIMVAMSRNHRSIVEDLVRAGATVNLHPAAYLGDVGRVRNLIDNGADITTRDRDGWTPLDYAVLYDHKEVAKLLLAAAADPNGLADGGVRTRDCVRDALRCALREGYEDMAELLINNNAPRAIQGGARETPLYWAAEYGRLRTVKLLLAKGANVNASTREGYKPLGAALGQGYADIVETLIAAGADVNVRDKAGRTLFTEAVTSYCEPAVEAAVKKKFDDSGPGRDAAFDAFARDIRDPLIARMVVLLVAHGADINEKDEAGVTPLHHAAEGGLKETVGFLLAKGAEVNAKTTGPRERRYETHSERVGTTPLHMAAASGDANTVKVLLAHGAELEARDQAG